MENKEERKRPTYLIDIIRNFKDWSQINDEEIDDAIEYASGNMYFEIRKMTSLLCQLNEKMVSRMIKKVDKNVTNDRQFLGEVFEVMRDEMEEMKKEMKSTIDATWRDMVDRQKVGWDKMSLILLKDKKLWEEKKEKK